MTLVTVCVAALLIALAVVVGLPLYVVVKWMIVTRNTDNPGAGKVRGDANTK